MISQKEQDWLNINHPDLYYNAKTKSIEGELTFKMIYYEDSKYVLNPDSLVDTHDAILIEDVFEISLAFIEGKAIPKVFETGGRIANSCKKWGVANPADLHLYNDGSACLCLPLEIEQKLPNGFNLKDFFHNLLIPFFFYQSYFEKYGKEIWAGYGHGYFGVLESLQNKIERKEHISEGIILQYIQYLIAIQANNIIQLLQTKKIVKGHHQCWCGSQKKIRDCHQKAMLGFNSLVTLISTLP